MLEGIKRNGVLPEQVHVDVLPTYYPGLIERAMRIMIRPEAVLAALRTLEPATSVTALGQRIEKPEDMGGL